MFRGERRSTSKFDFGSVDDRAVLEYLDGYMDASIYIAEKLDVDVLAHLTYIFRYINGKYKKNVDWHIQEEKIRRVFRALIARGIALEINTSCVGSFYDEWLPNREIVDIYIEMGGRLITLGSDAHKSEKIGTGFDEVMDYLRRKGIEYLVYYKNRKPYRYNL
jgi:histidinol-phosphatase (PHP family)